MGIFDLFSGKPPNSHTFLGKQLLRSNSRPKPSFRNPPCARTHSAQTKVQLYRFARRAVLVHTTATSSLMCHVITWSGDVSHRSGKDMRKKDEEWPRTGTFCAAWGRISVMQWPIFIGHFEALRFQFHLSGLTIPSVIYIGYICVCGCTCKFLRTHFLSTNFGCEVAGILVVSNNPVSCEMSFLALIFRPRVCGTTCSRTYGYRGA